jgi:hypothetical protein
MTGSLKVNVISWIPASRFPVRFPDSFFLRKKHFRLNFRAEIYWEFLQKKKIFREKIMWKIDPGGWWCVCFLPCPLDDVTKQMTVYMHVRNEGHFCICSPTLLHTHPLQSYKSCLTKSTRMIWKWKQTPIYVSKAGM